MEDFVKYINIAGTVLPLVRQSVTLAEDLGSGLTGTQKKDLAIAFVSSVIGGLKSNPNIKIKELDTLPIDFILAIVSMLIDSVVSIFNSTVWKKK